MCSIETHFLSYKPRIARALTYCEGPWRIAKCLAALVPRCRLDRSPRSAFPHRFSCAAFSEIKDPDRIFGPRVINLSFERPLRSNLAK